MEQHTNRLIRHFFLKDIKRITNDSTIGASKLLHFSNPKEYAIIDSNIYREITKGDKPHYNIPLQNYVLYIEKLKELKANTQEMQEIKSTFDKNNKDIPEMTDLRYLELAIWYTARDKK